MPEQKDKPKTLHSCAVMRYMLMCQPQETPRPTMQVLTGLLMFMHMSGYTKGDLQGNFFVSGSASVSQICAVTHYEDRMVRAHLKILQRAGFVNWVKREDHKGADYRVYAHPQEELIQEMEHEVDPKKSEQARKAAKASAAKRSGNLGQNGCGNSEAGSGNSEARGAVIENQNQLQITDSGTRSGTYGLELSSGTRRDTLRTTHKPDETEQLTSFEQGAIPRARSASSGLRPDPHREFTETPEPTRHPEGKAPLRGSGETSAAVPRRTQAELDRILEERKKAAQRAARLPRDPLDEELDRYFSRNRNTEARRSVYVTDEEGAAAELDD
jgi:DNA-binding MarR family transcriptional regulator